MKISVDDFRDPWNRLTPAMQTAILATILAAAGQAADPPRRTRHKQYTETEITELRAKITAILCQSPTLPVTLVAERINVKLSTFKTLGLHRFMRTVFAVTSAPISASLGTGGKRASDDD